MMVVTTGMVQRFFAVRRSTGRRAPGGFNTPELLAMAVDSMSATERAELKTIAELRIRSDLLKKNLLRQEFLVSRIRTHCSRNQVVIDALNEKFSVDFGALVMDNPDDSAQPAAPVDARGGRKPHPAHMSDSAMFDLDEEEEEEVLPRARALGEEEEEEEEEEDYVE